MPMVVMIHLGSRGLGHQVLDFITLIRRLCACRWW